MVQLFGPPYTMYSNWILGFLFLNKGNPVGVEDTLTSAGGQAKLFARWRF